MRGDSALITTAVRNLLDNAIRYSGPRTRVSVGVNVDHHHIQLSKVFPGFEKYTHRQGNGM